MEVYEGGGDAYIFFFSSNVNSQFFCGHVVLEVHGCKPVSGNMVHLTDRTSLLQKYELFCLLKVRARGTQNSVQSLTVYCTQTQTSSHIKYNERAKTQRIRKI